MPKKISSCPECRLKGSIEVPYRGNTEAGIVVILESPGASEERKGTMLIGPSYRVFKEEIDRVDIREEDLFFMNAARCKLNKDELSGGQMGEILSCCRPNVEMALNTIKPKLIIAMGQIATRQVYKNISIKNARNQFFWLDEFNCWLFVTYHPAAILRNASQRPSLSADFDQVASFIKNDFKHKDVLTFKEVESIRPILDGNCYKDGDYFVTAIDTEATGVDWENPNCICISYQVCPNPNEGWVIVLHEEVEKDQGDFNIFVQRGGTKKDPIYEEIGVKRAANFEQKVAELVELLNREDFKIYYMNANFEKHQFYNLGITKFQPPTGDVKVMAHCIDSELYRDVSLEELVTHFTNLSTNTKVSVTKAEKEDMIGLLKNNRDKFLRYSGADPCYTLQVAESVRSKLLEDELTTNYYLKLAKPIEQELLFEIERNGIMIDTKRLPEIRNKIVSDMAEITEKFKKQCPKQVVEKHEKAFRLSRDIIVKEALFEWKDGKLRKNQKEPEHHNYGYNLEPIVWNKKSGSPGTDKKKVMQPILEGRYPKKVKELVQTYLDWGELNKLLTNYINKFQKMLSPEGRLHPSASLTFTSSGRTGMKSPPLQTIPKRSKSAHYIRELIIPPEGYVLVECDYKVSELRWVGHVANDKKMISIFKQGEDPHKIVGLKVRGLPENYEFKDGKELKETRQHVKPINFGLIYGLQPPSLIRYAKQEYGVEYSLKQAKEFYDMFLYKEFKDIPIWHKKDTQKLRKQGYLRHVFGRKRVLPQVHSEEEYLQAQAIRTGLNFMIQGPSSDATLLGGYGILNDERMNKEECRIVLFIHDALVFEIKKEKLDYYLPIIKDYMENIPTEDFGFTLKLPLEIEAEVGKNLASMKEVTI